MIVIVLTIIIFNKQRIIFDKTHFLMQIRYFCNTPTSQNPPAIVRYEGHVSSVVK